MHNECTVQLAGLTFAQRPRESAKRAANAPLAGLRAVVVVRLIELQLEGLRVEVDLLLGLLPRQREGGDAVDARYHVPLPEARRPRLAPGVHLEVENTSPSSIHFQNSKLWKVLFIYYRKQTRVLVARGKNATSGFRSRPFQTYARARAQKSVTYVEGAESLRFLGKIHINQTSSKQQYLLSKEKLPENIGNFLVQLFTLSTKQTRQPSAVQPARQKHQKSK